MHINAISAAIDLRSAHLEQVEELGFDTALSQIFFDGQERVERFVSELLKLDSFLHGSGPPLPQWV
jgi:hypothetical protein